MVKRSTKKNKKNKKNKSLKRATKRKIVPKNKRGGGVLEKERNIVYRSDFTYNKPPAFITIDGEMFTQGEIIGQGAIGKVIQYTDRRGQRVVVKTFAHEEFMAQEMKAIETLDKTGRICNNGLVTYATDPDKTIIVMDYFEGDVEYLVSKGIIHTYRQMMDIFKQTTKTISCLHDIHLYYMDLKLSNVLFREKNGYYFTVLGDLGSCYPNEYIDNKGIARRFYSITFLPYDRMQLYDEYVGIQNPNEKDLVFLLGLFLAGMIDINFPHFYYAVIVKGTKQGIQYVYASRVAKKEDEKMRILYRLKEEHERRIEKLVDKTKEKVLKDILEGTLESVVERRWGLQQLQDTIIKSGKLPSSRTVN